MDRYIYVHILIEMLREFILNICTYVLAKLFDCFVCSIVCAHVLWDLLCLMHWICSCDLRVCKAVRICILVGKNCVSDL